MTIAPAASGRAATASALARASRSTSSGTSSTRPDSPATAASSTPLTIDLGGEPGRPQQAQPGRRARREHEPAGRRHRTSVPVPATRRNTPEPVAGYLRRPPTREPHAERRPSGAGPDQVDRRQGLDDRPPRRLRAPGRVAGRAGHVLPGAVLRPVLLPGAGHRVLRLRRAGARRADHPGDDGARPRARDGPRRPDLRAGAGGPALQHGGGHRRRRHLPRQVPEDPHPAGEGLLGEVLLPAREPRVPGVRHRRRSHRRLHLLRPPLPRGLAGPRPGRGQDRVQPVGHLTRPERLPLAARAARLGGGQRVLHRRHQPGGRRAARRQRLLRPDLLRRAHAGSSSGEVASTTDEELVVRDLDMDLLDEVRNQWAFYRDRRPDMYGPLTQARPARRRRTRWPAP